MKRLIGLLVTVLLSSGFIIPSVALSQPNTSLITDVEPVPVPVPVPNPPIPHPPRNPILSQPIPTDPRELRRVPFRPLTDEVQLGCSFSTCKPNFCLLCTKNIKQLIAGWCWNATAQIVMDYRGLHVSQCDIAQRVYDPYRSSPCCTTSDTPDPITDCGITTGGYPEYAFDVYGFSYAPLKTSPARSLTWGEIQSNIRQDRSYIALVQFFSTNAMGQIVIGDEHTLVVNGYRRSYQKVMSSKGILLPIRRQNEVHIFDPQEDDDYWLLYDVFYGGTPRYSHVGDTYDIEP